MKSSNSDRSPSASEAVVIVDAAGASTEYDDFLLTENGAVTALALTYSDDEAAVEVEDGAAL